MAQRSLAGGGVERLGRDGGETSAPADVALPVIRSRQLPPEVFTHILTRLPLKDAVRTSALSTAWRDLWCRLRPPDDSLEVEYKPGNSHSTAGQLRMLERRNGRHLKRFSLVVHDVDETSGGLLSCFLQHAFACAAEDLRIDLSSEAAEKDPPFVFPLSIHLASLTLCRLNLNARMFGVVHPMSSLAKIHLNTVRITDEALRDMVNLSPGLRVLELLCCSGPLAMITFSSATSRNLSSLVVMNCNNVREVIVVPDSPLHRFHYIGRPLSTFYLPRGGRSLTNLLFCFKTPILGHQVLRTWFNNNLPFLYSVTSLAICRNTLQVVYFLRVVNPDHTILNNFQSLTVLELIMFQFKAVDLDNIFVFLKSCHRPNLKKLVVKAPARTISDSDMRHLFTSETQPEVGLDKLEEAHIRYFNWSRYELQLLIFLLKKSRSTCRFLLVSRSISKFEELGLKQAELSLIQAALGNGRLVVQIASTLQQHQS